MPRSARRIPPRSSHAQSELQGRCWMCLDVTNEGPVCSGQEHMCPGTVKIPAATFREGTPEGCFCRRRPTKDETDTHSSSRPTDLSCR